MEREEAAGAFMGPVLLYLRSHPEGGSHRGVPPQAGICQLG